VEGDLSADILVAQCDLRQTTNVLTPNSLTGAVDLHNNIIAKK
jgi:hypothetical protein